MEATEQALQHSFSTVDIAMKDVEPPASGVIVRPGLFAVAVPGEGATCWLVQII